eukprot:Tbor_TRINITY_DN5617_c1_g1::TRINITY_DN5617_c1_g1_i6::g.8871::m.8871/K05309/PTGES2; microsomal prostaglandin-E synthase 2
MSKFFRKVAFVGGVSSVVGIGGATVAYGMRMKENKVITAEEFNAKQFKQDLIPALENLHKKMVPIKLYRYTTCPFCGIAKAFLDYHKIPYECVEVEPMFKNELNGVEYKKVPSLQFITSGNWGPFIGDSELIVSTMAKYVSKKTCDELNDPDVEKWRQWARRELVRFLVVNINVTISDAWHVYDYIDRFDTIPYTKKLFLKAMGSPIMLLVAKFKTQPALIEAGLMKKGDDVHEKLFERVNLFTTEALQIPEGTILDIKKRNAEGNTVKMPDVKFHGGNEPDLADLDVYGVLQSIRGHKLYMDIIENTDLEPWLSKMDELCGSDKHDPFYSFVCAESMH